MNISFTSNSIDFNKYRLGNHNVDRIPKMTDEEVALANSTRKLPEGYYVLTKETNYYTRRGKYRPEQEKFASVIYKQPVITLIKGNKDIKKEDKPQYFDTLPEGFELENNFCGTYMKKSEVKYTLLNRFQSLIYVSLGWTIALLLEGLKKLKK